jgi:SAM-dependent methyltransferase
MANPTMQWQDQFFLVPPDKASDWRMVLLYDAAVDTGLLDALPAHPAALAGRLGLREQAVRVVLEGLALWRIVVIGPDGDCALGPAAPDADARAMVRHHARAIRGWGTLADRLRGMHPSPPGGDIARVEIMLDALAVLGRESAPGAVEACLARLPDARRVLDLGGGHGMFGFEFARRGLAVTMQDRPEVIELVRRKGWLADSDVELFGGDFFQTLPDGPFDLVFCAGVVYTMGAERNLALFRRLRPLLAPGGILAVHTFLRGTDELATLFSAQMLGVSGGASHGQDELQDWLGQAGYPDVASQRLQRRPEWMLFASPAAD